MERAQELIVVTKTYDLIVWSCQHTSRFPRNHRFVLGERVERHLYDLLETLIRAKYTRQRQELLEANARNCWRRPTCCWKSCASRCASPRTCSASRWTATALPRRRS